MAPLLLDAFQNSNRKYIKKPSVLTLGWFSSPHRPFLSTGVSHRMCLMDTRCQPAAGRFLQIPLSQADKFAENILEKSLIHIEFHHYLIQL